MRISYSLPSTASTYVTPRQGCCVSGRPSSSTSTENSCGVGPADDARAGVYDLLVATRGFERRPDGMFGILRVAFVHTGATGPRA
jgi:hypothetical protein